MFAFTALNAHSSRSHAIVMLTITKRPAAAPQNRALGQKVKVGKLFLVDLAGSERLKKSRSTGALLSLNLFQPPHAVALIVYCMPSLLPRKDLLTEPISYHLILAQDQCAVPAVH